MSERMSREALVELLCGDGELLDLLDEAGLLPRRALAPPEVEQVLVARTLIRELEVNVPGVEIILRLRAELQQTRAQVHRLVQLLREHARGGGER